MLALVPHFFEYDLVYMGSESLSVRIINQILQGWWKLMKDRIILILEYHERHRLFEVPLELLAPLFLCFIQAFAELALSTFWCYLNLRELYGFLDIIRFYQLYQLLFSQFKIEDLVSVEDFRVDIVN